MSYVNQFDQLFTKMSRDYRQYMDSQLPAELTESQLTVLEYILAQKKIKPSDFTDYLATTPAAVTTLLDRMERNHLVIRERDAADRRVVWVNVTPKGKRLAVEGKKLREAFFSACLEHLSSHNQQLFVYLLGKVAAGSAQDSI